MAENRIVRTGLYSSYAQEILNNFFSHMSANSVHRMERNTKRVSTKVAADGEILLEAIRKNSWDPVHHEHCYGQSIWDLNENNDAKPKEWLAIALKHHIIASGKSDGVWRRNGEFVASTLSKQDSNGQTIFAPVVSELYCLYDHLLGRKNLEKRYGVDLTSKIIGTRRDPLLTQMEENRRNEVKRIEEELEAAKKAAAAKRAQLRSEYDKKLEAVETEEVRIATEKHDKELAEVEETMKAVLAMHGM